MAEHVIQAEGAALNISGRNIDGVWLRYQGMTVICGIKIFGQPHLGRCWHLIYLKEQPITNRNVSFIGKAMAVRSFRSLLLDIIIGELFQCLLLSKAKSIRRGFLFALTFLFTDFL